MSHRRYHDWLRGHGKKIKYKSKWQAQRNAIRLIFKGRYGLRPYSCTWGPSHAAGKDFEVHWHLGHRPKWLKRKGPKQRAWFWAHKLLIWPVCNVRRYFKRRSLCECECALCSTCRPHAPDQCREQWKWCYNKSIKMDR